MIDTIIRLLELLQPYIEKYWDYRHEKTQNKLDRIAEKRARLKDGDTGLVANALKRLRKHSIERD